MLLRAVLGLGVALVALALILLLVDAPWVVAVEVGLLGALLVATTLLEPRRYRGARRRPAERWQPTGERFVDPTTGRLVEVLYNPETGERSYVERGAGP